MNISGLLKIGLGLLGIIGAGYGLGNAFWGDTDEEKNVPGPTTEKDKEWYFLFRLGYKIFPYLKSKNPSDENLKRSGTLVDWLKKEFSSEDKSSRNNWKGFKELCEAYILKTEESTKNSNISDSIVEVPASRLCYIDEKKSTGRLMVIGQLGNWDSEYQNTTAEEDGSTTYNYGVKYQGFSVSEWGDTSNKKNTNKDLFDLYKIKYPNSDEPSLIKWEEWWSQEDNPDVELIRKTLETKIN